MSPWNIYLLSRDPLDIGCQKFNELILLLNLAVMVLKETLCKLF